ncbi:MAG: hypothetical protein QXL81_01955, partial [Candidatus Aenigmatarchaeota archaeon]
DNFLAGVPDDAQVPQSSGADAGSAASALAQGDEDVAAVNAVTSGVIQTYTKLRQDVERLQGVETSYTTLASALLEKLGIDVADQSYAERLAEIKRVVDEYARLRQEVEGENGLRATVQKLRQEVGKANETCLTAETKCAELGANYANALAENQRLAAANRTLAEDKRELSERCIGYINEHERLKRSHRFARYAAAGLLAVAALLGYGWKNASAERERLAEERRAYAVQNETLRGEKDSIIAENARIKKEIETYTAQLSALQKDAHAANQERDAWKAKAEEAATRAADYEAQLRAAQAAEIALSQPGDAADREDAVMVSAPEPLEQHVETCLKQLGEKGRITCWKKGWEVYSRPDPKSSYKLVGVADYAAELPGGCWVVIEVPGGPDTDGEYAAFERMRLAPVCLEHGEGYERVVGKIDAALSRGGRRPNEVVE